jgi:Ca-activated chloride channel homolog
MYLVDIRPLLWLLLLIPIFISYKYSLVDRPLGYRIAALVLRVLSVALIILALSRPFSTRKSQGLHVVFLVDVSESVDLTSARNAIEQIRQCTKELGQSDSWDIFFVADGIRTFKSTEQAAELLDQWLKTLPDDKFRGSSRIAKALLVTRMSFPADKARRVVLFSDGRETNDDVQTAIDALKKENIDIRYNQLGGLKRDEVCVTSLKPNTNEAYENEKIRFTAQAVTNSVMPAKIKLINRAIVVQQKDIVLDPNKDNIFVFDVEMTAPGANQWTIELAAEQDYFPINNQLSCTVNVGGKPRILILHEKPTQMRPFISALTEQGFTVDVRDNHGVPEKLEEMLTFDAVIFANISALDVKPEQMEMVKRYVTDFGGGFIMTGSSNSFGLGGYFKTPIEEVLPLTSRYEKEKEQPSIAMVLVIDKSGSMSGNPVALARQAAKATVELLGKQDQIGVVGFDSQAYVVCDMRSAMDADAIKSAIDTLAGDGGTNIYPGMNAAYRMLDTTTAKIKHVILLTDGHSQPDNHQGLVAEMANAGITLSTVAIGDADRPLLASLAEIGRGRYYETTDISSIPHIFTKETVEISSTAVKEDLFSVVQVGDHPMLSGIDEAKLPMILGYVMTRAKPATQLLLAVETGDPLLAISRYGLGTGMAYTSDMTDRWGSQWLNWEDFGRFWAQILRSVVRRNSTEGLFISQSADNDLWRIELTQHDKAGLFVNGTNWDAKVTCDDAEPQSIECRQAGLGRYLLDVPIQNKKTISLRLYDRDNDKMAVLHFHKPYPAEYNLAAKVDPAIEKIKPLSAEYIREDLIPIRASMPVSHISYLLALLALIAGLLARRL